MGCVSLPPCLSLGWGLTPSFVSFSGPQAGLQDSGSAGPRLPLTAPLCCSPAPSPPSPGLHCSLLFALGACPGIPPSRQAGRKHSTSLLPSEKCS